MIRREKFINTKKKIFESIKLKVQLTKLTFSLTPDVKKIDSYLTRLSLDRLQIIILIFF